MPWKIVVVNDQSTDSTLSIVKEYSQKYSFISYIDLKGHAPHSPGGKVVKTFNYGINEVSQADLICKFDADLIFPENYLEMVKNHFESDSNIGMCGGFCYILKNDKWILENLTSADHLRGPIKAYRKKCFQEIGGLKPAMGWDTADELLARFYNWKVLTDPSLKVKHLRATGSTYRLSSHLLQGRMFYTLRYGVFLSFIACLKLSVKKRSITLFFLYVLGYIKAVCEKPEFLVSQKQGVWIRKYRYKNIIGRLLSYLRIN